MRSDTHPNVLHHRCKGTTTTETLRRIYAAASEANVTRDRASSLAQRELAFQERIADESGAVAGWECERGNRTHLIGATGRKRRNAFRDVLLTDEDSQLASRIDVIAVRVDGNRIAS